MSTQTTIDSLTDKGRATMTSIGRIAYGGRELGFFDGGVTAGSGSWGECLTGELGHRSAGVINRLAKLGLFTVSHDYNGAWFELTELGAEVALQLAAPPAAEVVVPDAPAAEVTPAEPTVAGERGQAFYALARLATALPDNDRASLSISAHCEVEVHVAFGNYPVAQQLAAEFGLPAVADTTTERSVHHSWVGTLQGVPVRVVVLVDRADPEPEPVKCPDPHAHLTVLEAGTLPYLDQREASELLAGALARAAQHPTPIAGELAVEDALDPDDSCGVQTVHEHVVEDGVEWCAAQVVELDSKAV